MSIFPTKILLATDGSREVELAATSAADLAQKTGSEVHVVHAFGIAPVGPPVYPEATDLQGEALEAEVEESQRISEQRAREVLEVEVGKVRSGGVTVAEAHLIEGRVAPEVVALAEEIGAGLIVMGSRGYGGIRRALMGSVSDSVVRHAHCPVLVVRADPIVFPIKILVATDGSKEAELASSSAADLVKSTGSELHLTIASSKAPDLDYMVRKYPFEDAEEALRAFEQEPRLLLEEQVRKIERAGGTVREVHLRMGEPPERAIVGLGEEIGAGLIVMGSRGRGGIRRALMGSVSDSVVRHAHCPVLIVRENKGLAA
jgi:nucleotide-binding universal stress UspA family protein